MTDLLIASTSRISSFEHYDAISIIILTNKSNVGHVLKKFFKAFLLFHKQYKQLFSCPLQISPVSLHKRYYGKIINLTELDNLHV